MSIDIYKRNFQFSNHQCNFFFEKYLSTLDDYWFAFSVKVVKILKHLVKINVAFLICCLGNQWCTHFNKKCQHITIRCLGSVISIKCMTELQHESHEFKLLLILLHHTWNLYTKLLMHHYHNDQQQFKIVRIHRERLKCTYTFANSINSQRPMSYSFRLDMSTWCQCYQPTLVVSMTVFKN